jgi:hypothetical protein
MTGDHDTLPVTLRQVLSAEARGMLQAHKVDRVQNHVIWPEMIAEMLA